jgi:hypothetical protein
MSSVVSFGTNVNAQRKRVYYFGTSTIYEGMPVCYDNSTTNVLEIDTGASNAVSTTTTEGGQNEGKFLRVENPNADNVGMFAGVVAHGPKVSTTGPAWLDIFIPNGAVVPVRTDSNCLIDQTILAVTTGSQELGVPLATDSRPVAIARETIDRGTAGLTLAQLCPERFVFQDSGGTALSIDDADTTTATTVNSINLNFLGSGQMRGLYAVGKISGAGHSNYGMWKFRTYLNAAASQTVHALCANLHLQDSATLTDTGEYASAALYVTVETEVTTTAPTLSGGSLAGIYIGYYVDESTAAPANAYAIQTNSHASYGFDGLLRCQNAADLGIVALTGDHTFDTSDKAIPVDIAGTTYYIYLADALT